MLKESNLRIVIADDHRMFATGIASLLDPHFGSVTTVHNKTDLIHHLEQDELDTVLLDIDLGEEDGIQICNEISRRFENVHVIALTMHDEGEYIRRMIEAGAKGYLLKESPIEEVIQAITTVDNGCTYLSSKATDNMMQNLTHHIRRHPIRLSRREKEVLKLIMNEYTTDEIAKELHVSKHTIETHRSNLIAKMDVRNVAGLVKKALELNILDQVNI